MPRTKLGPDEGKRFSFGVRTNKAMKEKLEAAAKASGRSIVQEVEIRLLASFAAPASIPLTEDRVRAIVREEMDASEGAATLSSGCVFIDMGFTEEEAAAMRASRRGNPLS